MDLKPIERTDRAKGRLHEALSIYRETILPEAQNPERQILYWIDHSKETLADEFRCFAIERNNCVVGYLQYSYFREENIFFFEYLCIADRKRPGLAPSETIKTISNYLAENYPPDFTIVFEVAQKRTSANDWKADERLIAYFKRLGFRTVDFNYRYPILQSYDGEMSYPADLLVRLPKCQTTISAFAMRTILRSIYFKHYLRWDRPFLEPERFRERERLINALYSKEIEEIGDNDSFGTRGDDKRISLHRFTNGKVSIFPIVNHIFGPKLPRITIVVILLLVAQHFLGTIWLFCPFVLAVAALHCLAEDTDSSRKLFTAILARFKFSPPRSS